MISGKTIGFIGTGNMAYAIAGGILKANLIPAKNIYGSDVFSEAAKKFQSLNPEINIIPDNHELVSKCDILILAVKPQSADELLASLDSKTISTKIIVSIMAGKTIDSIVSKANCNPEQCKVVRVMPNTPLMVNCGASGIVGSKGTSKEEIEMVAQIFACAGEIAIFDDEKMLDPVTALSGSGPGYVFAFIEALAAGAEKQGIPKDIALRFAIQTVYGAGKLAHERFPETSPTQLREMVTSKGGTTLAALDYLKDNDFANIIEGAMKACHDRAVELAKL